MNLVDANVLLRQATRTDPMRIVARTALLTLRRRGETLVVSTQVVAEAWVVATRPVAQRGGFGIDCRRAKRLRRIVERFFVPLPDPFDLYSRWTALIDAHQIVGVNAHEARLVAVKEAHGVREILTFNAKDFQRYSGVAAVDPMAVK